MNLFEIFVFVTWNIIQEEERNKYHDMKEQ